MESPKKFARFTGILGLFVLAAGSFTHYVNSKLIVTGDIMATADNFINYETLFRLGFISSLLMETIFIFYAFNLNILLKPVNKSHSHIMLLLALIPVPLFMVNQLHQFDAFLLAKSNMEEMMFVLSTHKNGGLIVSIFFGLWLFPLGLLIYKSTFFPKILGILLMIGCFGYLIHFFQGFLVTNYTSSLWTNPFLVITHISELLLMLWLLMVGVNSEKWRAIKN